MNYSSNLSYSDHCTNQLTFRDDDSGPSVEVSVMTVEVSV